MRKNAVALLAEGVDRNIPMKPPTTTHNESPSSRRAWIEMMQFSFLFLVESLVALLAEGVDRNMIRRFGIQDRLRRPPRGGRG